MDTDKENLHTTNNTPTRTGSPAGTTAATKEVPENKPVGIKKFIAILLMTLLWFFGSLFFIFLTLDWLGTAGIIPGGTPLSGFDYIPPLGIFLLLIPSSTLALLAKRWRVAAVMAALLLLFSLAVGDHSLFTMPQKKDPASYPRRITALSLNVAQFYTGIDRLGARLEELKPDVMCFQETEEFSKIGYDTIKKAFPSYHVALAKISDNAILSLYPIVEFHEVELPSRWPIYEKNTPEAVASRPHRQFLHAVVDMDGTRVHVLNLRLIAGRGKNLDESPRDVYRWGRYLMDMQRLEALAMADYIAKLDGPVIYMGDMNASPNCRALSPLYRQGYDTARATNLFPQKSFPGDGPYQRLDYIFCTPQLEPISTAVLPWVVSDHRPVYAVLGFRENPATAGK